MDLLDLILAFLGLSRQETTYKSGLSRLAGWTAAAQLVLGWGLLAALANRGSPQIDFTAWIFAVGFGAFSGPPLVALCARRRSNDCYPLWLICLVLASGPVATCVWRLLFYCYLHGG